MHAIKLSIDQHVSVLLMYFLLQQLNKQFYYYLTGTKMQVEYDNTSQKVA